MTSMLNPNIRCSRLTLYPCFTSISQIVHNHHHWPRTHPILNSETRFGFKTMVQLWEQLLHSLFLAYYETKVIIPQFRRNLVYFKRFIDDGIVIWNPHGAQYAYKHFQAIIRRSCGLSFTFEAPARTIAFLDL